MGLSEKFTELVFDQFTKNAQMKKEKEAFWTNMATVHFCTVFFSLS